jgi:pyruvate dehydrogenase E2 component (dihydrolipoamide acetyltransferase)
MIHEIILPMLGETMDEGQITAWRKAEGDKVTKGESLFEVTTDKAAFEVESPTDGYLRKILFAPSETPIPVAKVIGYIGDTPDEPLPSQAESAPARATSAKAPVEDSKSATVPTAAKSVTAAADTKRIKISPLARKLAVQNNLDIQQLRGKGTGPGGRITKKDVLAVAPSAPVAPSAQAPPAVGQTREVPMSKMRQVIARRLSLSKQTIPHYYLTAQVKVDNLIKLRLDLIDTVKKACGTRLTYTDLIVKAVGIALSEFPTVNATFDGEKILMAAQANVGIAVAVPGGLVVPVIKAAASRPLASLVADRAALVAKARAKKLSQQDMSGGSFTVTNLGTQPIYQFTAIINPPEVAILAIGQITKAPLVDEADHVVVGSIMRMTLSADHRVVDGAVGAEFLARLINILEGPYQLLTQGI